MRDQFLIVNDNKVGRLGEDHTGSQRIAMRTGSETYLLFGDHLASSILLVRGEGTVAEKAYYLPWGGTRGDETITSTAYAYTGQMREGDIYYYNARWLKVPEAKPKGFDPSIGRFMQADTIVPLQVQGTQAFDRYAYVNNNPLRYTDPSGFYIIDGWDDDYLQLQDGNACGVVALAMGLSVLYQKKVTQADLQSMFPFAKPIPKTDLQGIGVLPSLLSAKTNLALGRGVIATRQPNGSIEELKQNIFDNKPTIVLIQLPEKKSIGHYLLIIGYSDEEGFIFADPHNIRRNELEFVDRWGKERGFSSFTEVWSQDYWPALQPNTMITLEYNTGTTYGTFLQYVNYQNPTRLTGRWGDREETR